MDLADYEEGGKLNFEMSAALEDMIESSQGWYEGYLKTKQIHHSGAWRADAQIIKNTIEPNLEKIDTLLIAIDKEIELSGNQDVAALTRVAKMQTTMLILITGIGLGFMLFILLSLNRLVFRPIGYVARALKAEAFGKQGLVLPSVRSEETQSLIDAFSEMRKQVHARQSELEYQALHDSLTDLPNRTLLRDRMNQAINVARRDKQSLVLLMLDLDRFKEINDTLGHHIGDQVLKEVGNRLIHSLRQMDTVARLGGDEYAILLPDTDIGDAELIAKKISSALENVFNIDELNLFIKASIGLAEYPTHGDDATSLVQHADVAMYIAKRGQLDYAIYNPKEDEYSIGRLALIGDLREALANNKLNLNFQPIIDLRNGRCISTEALLRWKHEKYGDIPPDQIIALAEQTGAIDDVTNWVLEEASKQYSQWRSQNQSVKIAINISMSNLRNPKLIDQLSFLTRQYNLAPDSFTLEITESAMMANPKRSLDTLLKINEMGIKLSIDDFGTGFSSLAYLKKLPVSELKIDKSFVMDLLEDENDLAIVRSTIDLAHNLGIKVIAEGVESEAIYNVLCDLHCDAAQGFYISQPLIASSLVDFISQRQQSIN
jgi:diguanylate cyclase (GGDEF)-like protein